MYNVNQILNRTFDNWGTMLEANEFSFWGVSVVEIKPTPEIETPTPTAPTETDNADTTDAMSATLENLTETVQDVFEEFNPFRDPEENS